MVKNRRKKSCDKEDNDQDSPRTYNLRLPLFEQIGNYLKAYKFIVKEHRPVNLTLDGDIGSASALGGRYRPVESHHVVTGVGK